MSPDRDAAAARPWYHRAALLALGLLTLTALQRTYIHSAVVARIARLHERIAAVERDARQRENDRAGIPDLERALVRAKREVEERIASIALVTDRPVLLAELAQMARGAGLRIVRFLPGAAVQREGYGELPIRLDLEGRFHDFVRFLSALAQIPHFGRLGSLTIAAQETHPIPSSLGISLEILTYALPENIVAHRTGSAGGGAEAQPEPPASEINALLAGIASLEGLRDPFAPPERSVCGTRWNGLESYDLSELRLAGIVWESRAPRGLIIDGMRSGHIVRPGSRIGNRGGVVEAITPTHLVVRENAAGTGASTTLALPVFTFGGSAETRNGAKERQTTRGSGTGVAVPALSACTAR